MIADVVSIAAMGMNFVRIVAPNDAMWRVIDPFARHLSLVAFHVVLQSFLLSACYSG
jgi:hypothetical protein